MSEYIDQQIEQKEYAEESLLAINSTTSLQEIQNLNQQELCRTHSSSLSEWTSQRQNLTDALVSSCGEEIPKSPRKI
ncbi:MAG: hypothetical protein U5P10_08275 [Spirochaetia bacterium]|nr:hypothetical protein [Spirochaetia bacterium]